jgi:phosphate starvation-inducible PhoH-like protein
MLAHQQVKVRKTRSTKEKPAAIKEKFVEQRLTSVVTITPKTDNQAKALDMMKKRQVVVLRGSSGTGKSYLACTHAANQYLKGEVERIVLVRPYEHVGRSVGLRPGTGDEKLRPIMQSMLQSLERVFGKAQLEAKIAAGNVVLEALEDVRGRSYSKSIVVVDEAQNTDKTAMKALLTRLEESSQLIICGDGRQKDTKTESGIDWAVGLLDKARKERPSYLNDADYHQACNNFGSVTFTNDDIVRSGFTALMVKLFDAEE